MPVYEYTAYNASGKNITGIVDAESAPAARQKLRNTRIYPIAIRETQKTSASKTRFFSQFSKSLARVNPAEITMMTRQMATLVGAGFPLVSALDTLLPQTRSHSFKRILAQIKDSVVEGNSYAAALSAYPQAFSPIYINMVRAGESSGTLEIVLDRLADIAEKQQALRNRIISALAYPVLMATIGFLVLFFLITYIVPGIASIFQDMEKALPLPTEILITAGDWMKNWWWAACVLLVIGWIAFSRYIQTERGRWVWDRVRLQVPLLGPLIRKLAVARFTRTLGSLLENGVTMLAALEIVKNVVGNVLLARAIENASENVGKGRGLGVSLDEARVFPALSIQMILVGEQSGELEQMLEKVAGFYESEVESSVLRMTAMLEPIMILVMAVVVGFIVLSICLPIFEMNTLIR